VGVRISLLKAPNITPNGCYRAQLQTRRDVVPMSRGDLAMYLFGCIYNWEEISMGRAFRPLYQLAISVHLSGSGRRSTPSRLSKAKDIRLFTKSYGTYFILESLDKSKFQQRSKARSIERSLVAPERRTSSQYRGFNHETITPWMLNGRHV